MRLLAEYSPMIDKPFSVGVILGIFTTGGDKLLQLLEELPVIKNNNNHTLLSPAAILTGDYPIRRSHYILYSGADPDRFAPVYGNRSEFWNLIISRLRSWGETLKYTSRINPCEGLATLALAFVQI